MTREAEYQRRLLPSNPRCIHAGALGFGCRALWAVDDGCQDETCPFFKTEEAQALQESKCAARCFALGIKYHTVGEVYDSYQKQVERKKEYYDALRNK